VLLTLLLPWTVPANPRMCDWPEATLKKAVRGVNGVKLTSFQTPMGLPSSVASTVWSPPQQVPLLP